MDDMDEQKYCSLRLANQLCFPLYACSKEIKRAYKPFLDQLDLTYTQYITMMVLWEKKKVNVKMLGDSLFLDSGTLTPVLKKLESKGYIRRERSSQDERNLEVTITEEGVKLQEDALSIPKAMGSCMSLDKGEMKMLDDLLYKLIRNVRGH